MSSRIIFLKLLHCIRTGDPEVVRGSLSTELICIWRIHNSSYVIKKAKERKRDRDQNMGENDRERDGQREFVHRAYMHMEDP